MIDVKEMREDNDPYAFRDPAEMVTISADRFERMVRKIESQRNDLFYYDEKLTRAYDFINTVASEWAERGQQIPTYEDLFRMSEILGWTEPADIRRTRERVLAEKRKAQEAERIANNAKEAERLAKHLQEVKENGEATD